jgi:hypothetical protein
VALGLTQLLTKMSTTNLPWGRGRPERKAEPNVEKMWDHRHLTTIRVPTASYTDSFTTFTAYKEQEVGIQFVVGKTKTNTTAP